MDQSPSVTAKTLRLLGENKGVNLCDFRFGSRFLDMASKAQATKQNIQKMDFLKIKNFYTSKGIIKKVRR